MTVDGGAGQRHGRRRDGHGDQIGGRRRADDQGARRAARVVGRAAALEHGAVQVDPHEHAEHAGQLEGQREGGEHRVGVAGRRAGRCG